MLSEVIMATINENLCEEISQIITNHINDLGRYFPMSELSPEQVPDNILACAERLSDICLTSPRTATYETYCDACECYEVLKTFLGTMNQPIDIQFQDTTIGRVFLRASTWRQIANRKFQLTLDEAWELISPAVPDHLEELGDGQYEARWWKPVPVMDLEMLKYTEGVFINGKPFEPKELPGGLALRFSLCPDARD